MGQHLFPAGQSAWFLPDSPPEIVLLGDTLHHQGVAVLCMRMAGHSTKLEDMKHIHGENCLYSVMDSCYICIYSIYISLLKARLSILYTIYFVFLR